ncbi:MAG: class I SAM-dependent methyltransferase [Chloroflexi bacterium]|nr:class I SAM-dependent methyltransferase [Chloroflexota bacterium]
MFRKLFFEFQYRFAKPPWDSGITPPEVVAFVDKTAEAFQTLKVSQRRALDLGCGTGTNAIFLAQRGFAVIGVDFSSHAIATARAKAKRANLAIDFHVADVSRLDFLSDTFDFVLDIGCLHGVDPARRAQSVAHIARLTRPGGVFMLYTFSPRASNERGHLIQIRNVGITPDDVIEMCAPHFALTHIEHGMSRGQRASAWFWFKRKSEI